MNYLIIIIFIIILLLILYNLGNRCENFITYSSKRKIKIFAPNAQMFNIKRIIETYKEEFNKRNVDVEYIVASSFMAELYGYDGELKKTIIKMEKIKELFTEIDNMPIGSLEKKDIEDFYNKDREDFYNKDRKQQKPKIYKD